MTTATAADPADRPITLVELRALVAPTLATGRPLVSLRAVQGWASRGVFGHRLRTVRVGGKQYTRLRWFDEFQAAVNGDTRTPLGNPGRPVVTGGTRRPTPSEARPMDLFDGVDDMMRQVAAARAEAAAKGVPTPPPDPLPATDGDPLAPPTGDETARRIARAKQRLADAAAAGDGDAAVRAIISRLAVDDDYRRQMSGHGSPLTFGTSMAYATLAQIAAGVDPTAAGDEAVKAIQKHYAADELAYRLASGAFLDVMQKRTVEKPAGE